MKTLVLGTAVSLIASAAFGVSLKDLNIARDPENLDGAVFATTTSDLNLRSGPGFNFTVIGAVPAGARVPVIGWITRYREDGFWIRTWYDGRKGWLCSYQDAERLLERDGGPIFPLAVAVDELEFSWLKDRERRAWENVRLKRGDRLGFVSVWGGYWEFRRGADYCAFFATYDGKPGYVYAFGDDEHPVGVAEPAPGPETTWFIEYPPELLALSLTYYRPTVKFAFTGPEERAGYYRGPGFEYGAEDSVFLDDDILFVEGPWALVWSSNEWSWIYVGTDNEPNVQMYALLASGDCAAPKDAEIPIGEVWVEVKRDYWPEEDTIYVELRAPYFCEYKERAAVDSVTIYQPPDAAEPSYAGPAGAGAKDGWHETCILRYGVNVPAAFDPAAPFRFVAVVSYSPTDKFTMDFDCNARR